MPAAWLFLLTFVVRLFVLNGFTASPYFLPDDGDMKFYNDWALRIASGQLTDHQAFYGLPGYAYLLALIYSTAGYSPYLAGFLQALCDAGTASVIFLLARETLQAVPRGGMEEPARDRQATVAGILAGAGWAFFLPAQTFSAVLMPTAWVIAVFWLVVLRLVRTEVVSAWRPWLWIGLLIGGTAMIIATILFLIPLVIVAILIEPVPARAGRARLSIPVKLLAGGVLITAIFAGCSPIWMHNYFVAREPVLFSAHSGLNFYIGNNPAATGYPKMPPGMRAGQAGMLTDSITMAERAEGRPLRHYEVSRYWSARADTYIREHPVDWLLLIGKKIRNVWSRYQYDDLSLVALFQQCGLLTPGLKFGFVAALALPGMLLAWRRFPRSRWIIAASLLHLASLLSVFVTERYRMAAVPGLLLMASAGLVLLWENLAARRWVAASGYLAALAAAFGFVCWPVSDPSLWALDYHNIGIKATRAGEIDLARENLEKALELVPDNAETLFGLGNVWLEKGDRTLAKSYYRRTLELQPAHDGAWNNLGVLAMEENYLKFAETCFHKSLDNEPADAKTHFLLAQVEVKQGNRTAAREAIAAAITLDPARPEFTEFQHQLAASTATP